MASIKLKIVTPEREISQGEAYSVTLPILEGEITILANHIPYIGALIPGEIMVRRSEGAEPEFLATSGGFVEFHNNNLTLLADTAERAEEIDLARAEEAKRRAEAIMRERISMDEEEYARVAAALEKELVRLKVARKHASRRGVIAPGVIE